MGALTTAPTGPRVMLPHEGTDRETLRRRMDEAAAGDADWLRRMAVGTNYPAGDDVLEVAKEAYVRFFSTNGLLPDIFPSLARFEREVIDYAAGLFHGPDAVGSITSGGSESILMGVKSARDRARRLHPEIREPEMVVPGPRIPRSGKAPTTSGSSSCASRLGRTRSSTSSASRPRSPIRPSCWWAPRPA